MRFVFRLFWRDVQRRNQKWAVKNWIARQLFMALIWFSVCSTLRFAFFHVLWLSACDLLKLVFFFLCLFIQIEMLWVEFWILAAYKMNQKLITRFAGMSRFSKCWCLDRLVFALRTSIDRRLVDFVFVSSPVKVIFYCCGPMDTLVSKRFSYFRRVVDLNIFFLICIDSICFYLIDKNCLL